MQIKFGSPKEGSILKVVAGKLTYRLMTYEVRCMGTTTKVNHVDNGDTSLISIQKTIYLTKDISDLYKHGYICATTLHNH